MLPLPILLMACSSTQVNGLVLDEKSGWRFHPLFRIPPGRMRAGGFSTRTYPTEERYETKSAAAVPVEGTHLAPGWYSVTLPSTVRAYGLYAVSTVPEVSHDPTGLGHVAVVDALHNGWAVKVDAPPAEVVEVDGHKLLQVEVGSYLAPTQPWETALQVVIAWCERPEIAPTATCAGAPPVPDLAGSASCPIVNNSSPT